MNISISLDLEEVKALIYILREHKPTPAEEVMVDNLLEIFTREKENLVRLICPKCPNCKQHYEGYPALSRRDNKTEICSECGVKEAWEDLSAYQKKIREKVDVILPDGKKYNPNEKEPCWRCNGGGCDRCESYD